MREWFLFASWALLASFPLDAQAQEPAAVEIHTNSAGEEVISLGVVLDDSGLLVTVAPSVEPKATFSCATSNGPVTATVALFDSISRVLLLKPSASVHATAVTETAAALSPGMELRWSRDEKERPMALAGMVAQVKGQPLPLAHVAVHFAAEEEPSPGTPLWTVEGKLAAFVMGPLPDAAPAWLCLPATAAAKVLTDFHAVGRVDTSQLELGIAVGTSLPRVEFVREGSRAALAGVQAGDVILQLGPRSIQTVLDILDASFYQTSRQSFELRVLRGTQTLQLTAPVMNGKVEKKDE